MSYLVCNIADNLIRKISDNEIVLEKPLDEVWYVQPFDNSKNEIELNVPEPIVQPIGDGTTAMKWKNPADDKWYRIKKRADFPRKYVVDTGLIETTLDKFSENLEEEIL